MVSSVSAGSSENKPSPSLVPPDERHGLKVRCAANPGFYGLPRGGGPGMSSMYVSQISELTRGTFGHRVMLAARGVMRRKSVDPSSRQRASSLQ